MHGLSWSKLLENIFESIVQFWFLCNTWPPEVFRKQQNLLMFDLRKRSTNTQNYKLLPY